MLQGKWEQEMEYLRKANTLHHALGLISQVMWARLDEANFFTERGQVDDGLAMIAEAICGLRGACTDPIAAFRLRRDLLALKNVDPPSIEAAYRGAIECAQSQSRQIL